MVISEGVKPETVAVAPAGTSATLVLDGSLPFGPAPQFSIELDEVGGQPVQVARSPEAGGTPAAKVLSSIATKNFERARRIQNSSDAWIQAGFAATASGDYASATEAFERALLLDASSRSARLGLARVKNERGDGQGAIAILRELFAASPDDTEVRVSLAIALTGASQYADALGLLQTEEPAGPNNANLFAARGAVHIRLGQYREAISDLRKVVRFKPDWVHARNSLGIAELKEGHSRAAERHFREAARVGPLYPEAALNLLRFLKVQKRWQDLVQSVEERWTPETAPLDVAMLAGDAFLTIDDDRSARLWLATAKERAGDSAERADILNNLGVALFRLDRPDEAGEPFEEAAKLKPTALTVANRAKAYMQEGRYDAALAWLASWQGKIEFDEPELLRTLALTLFHLEQFATAVEILGAPPMRSHPSAETQALLSMIYSDGLQDYEAAIGAARIGLQVDPENCGLLNNLAYALLEVGRVEEAAEVLGRVDESKATKTSLVCLAATNGLLALQRGELAVGLAGYERALSISPFNSLRERVKAKRDLEGGRAMLRLGYPVEQARALLARAANVEKHAEPYTKHAQQELARLPSPKSDDASND